MQLLEITISDYLHGAVAKWPTGLALVQAETGKSMTWSELDDVSDRFACGLMQMGLKKGDSILLWMGNRLEWCIAFFAAVKCGIIPSGLYPQLEQEEVRHLVVSSGAKAVVFSDGYKGQAYDKLRGAIESAFGRESQNGNTPPILIYTGSEDYRQTVRFESVLSAVNPTKSLPLEINPFNVAVVSYTSGTTRHPKGVMLTHYGLVNNSMGTAGRFGLRHSDRLCLPVSLAHCFGLVSGLLVCVATGAGMVLLESFRAEHVMACVEKYACTALHGVPTMFQRIFGQCDLEAWDFSSLRTGIVAGAVCPPAVMQMIVERLGMKEIVVAYGQTEASPGCTQTSEHDALEKKLTTIGKPLPFVEMCVIDPVTHAVCAPYQPGELCTRGYHVMKGYRDMPEESAALIDENGWFHLGDMGFVDQEGYYHYVGRLKDIIIRCGENISPLEIEAALLEHGAVRDAKVYSVPSEDYGEEIAATVQLEAGSSVTSQELREFLTGRIARFKIPSFIEFCPCFDTVASGKVNVRLLKERMIRNISSGKQVRLAANF